MIELWPQMKSSQSTSINKKKINLTIIDLHEHSKGFYLYFIYTLICLVFLYKSLKLYIFRLGQVKII